MHLATRKGTADVFLGTALANDTNQIRGQASWIKNESVLSFSNASQVALNAFNALSILSLISNRFELTCAIKKMEIDNRIEILNILEC